MTPIYRKHNARHVARTASRVDGVKRDASLTSTAIANPRALQGFVNARDPLFPYQTHPRQQQVQTTKRRLQTSQQLTLPLSNLNDHIDRQLTGRDDQLPLEKPHAIALGLALLLISLGLLSFVL